MRPPTTLPSMEPPQMAVERRPRAKPWRLSGVVRAIIVWAEEVVPAQAAVAKRRKTSMAGVVT